MILYLFQSRFSIMVFILNKLPYQDCKLNKSTVTPEQIQATPGDMNTPALSNANINRTLPPDLLIAKKRKTRLNNLTYA